MLSHAGTFLVGFGTAWAIGLVATSDHYRRRGRRLTDIDLFISLLTPATFFVAGVALTYWG